ncbi:hypothetical protein WJX72_007795 [[Myrmecia] bisecta]|uniref:G-patch domain-containing protein n=1 Tax=[Myrmecia] bisecta TaxID=41462 RepID=A0AAW1Q7Q1_9CHLO
MPRGGRRSRADRRALQLEQLQGSEEADGVLHIGGIRLHCNSGEVQGYSRKGSKPRRRHREESEEEAASAGESGGWATDDAVQDYMQNLAEAEASDDSGTEQDPQELLAAMASFGEAHLGAGPSVDGGALPGVMQTFSSGDADSEDSTTSGYNSDISIADIVDDFNDGLSLKQRYPTQFREPWQKEPSAGASTSGRGKSRPQRSAVRGARGGKLLPGEKKQLKRVTKEAKRAARAASRGFDPYHVNVALRDFVASQGDMKAFPPMGKYGLERTQKLASCYGLKSSQQGSGNRRFVVVAATNRTCMPLGQTLTKILQLLEAHNKASACFNVGAAACTPMQRRSRGEPKPKRRQSLNGPSIFVQPMTFVSSGVIDPAASPLVQVELRRHQAAAEQPQQQAAALSSSLFTASMSSPLQPMFTVAPGQGPQAAADMLAQATGADTIMELAANVQVEESAAGAGLGYRAQEAATCEMAGLAIHHYHQQSFKRGLSDPGSSSQVTLSDREMDSGSQQSLGPPMVLQTRKQHRNAGKKREKLQRRLSRARTGPGPSPLQPQAVAMEAVETSLQFGEFERHTTGFGSRMLAKWGFAGQGSGLGRADQGIAEPLGAVMRPKKLGLGA